MRSRRQQADDGTQRPSDESSAQPPDVRRPHRSRGMTKRLEEVRRVQTSQEVVAFAGGSSSALLNHYGTGGNTMVTTQQVDEWVFVVGQDDFNVARYTLAEWLGESEQDPD